MWFKNLTVLTLPAHWHLDPAQLAEALERTALTEGSSLEANRVGWVPPREGDPALVYALDQQLLITLREEKKLLPTRVINQFVRQRAQQIEEREGFKPGRKRLKELKEQVYDELVPRAFSLSSDTRAWIDPVGGWLIIDAASHSRADTLIGLLSKTLDGLPARPLRTAQSPAGAMTAWLVDDDAPAGFSIDQDVELKARDTKASVRFTNQTLETEDVTRHTRTGKQCTKLALTWNNRVSFVLTENLTVRRVRPLDVLQEAAGTLPGADANERFASDWTLMTRELAALLDDLRAALGGAQVEGGVAPRPLPLAEAA
jgi:recombination associated protein RdgC